MAGILPQEEPCNKAYDEHETPGIHIGIPGVSYLAHSGMVSSSLRVSPVAAAIVTAEAVNDWIKRELEKRLWHTYFLIFSNWSQGRARPDCQ